ncbi:hypothetical protein NliqN6_6567 [Naganishia liquefaciens]|uniref:t-SNARE coiled-coil homology domain-containing protein n=1 Tax=Naganishia liquefaciens TaxID=104408 RepID=A0A8H3U0C6_9TREE|nr:hypothetical protein NliqN6_6567 [Naganishia liquefaciens]
MSRRDNTLERQNDAELGQLHGKIKQLRSVTIDILSDSQRQNEQLDRTANTFTQFTNSLMTTTRHQARTFSAQSAPKQLRTIGYIVLALVLVYLFGGFVLGLVMGGGKSEGGIVVGDEAGVGL